MNWSEKVFRYCERGQDIALSAEPLNAASSVAFLIVAGIAAWRLRAGTPQPAAVMLMVVLVALIGVGSFLFHVVAARWAQLADVAPITLFMLLYLMFAQRSFLGLRWPATTLGAIAFLGALYLVARLCPPTDAAQGLLCLNRGAGYVPPLLVLAGVGGLLRLRGHPAGARLLMAGAVFLAALAFRTADMFLCAATGLLWSRPAGLHFVWHLLVAATVHLLLTAAIANQKAPP